MNFLNFSGVAKLAICSNPHETGLEDIQQIPYGYILQYRSIEGSVPVHRIGIGSRLSGPGYIPRFAQIGDDPEHGPLSNPQLMRNLYSGDPRLPEHGHQHTAVVGDEVPPRHVNKSFQPIFINSYDMNNYSWF